jgi:flagellar biosynthesis GTPase FlhF
MMDVLRSSVCGFITTSPSMNGVMKVIADETGYKVMILNSNNNNTKCAKVYVRYETPWGQMRVKKVFKNEFPFHLPDDIFEKVMKKRRMYNKEIMSSEVKEYGKDN